MIPIKSIKEVDQMRRACRTASEILDRVSELVRPGISTKEVDEAAADFMQEANVKSAFLGYRLGHRVFPGNIARCDFAPGKRSWNTAGAGDGGDHPRWRAGSR